MHKISLRHRHDGPGSDGLRGGGCEAGFLGFHFYPRSEFMHIDLGPKREWGERFAPRPAFAREKPPARERLVESRTIKGGGVAGVATVGAADVEVAQEALAEAQDAVLPLVQYLDTLRWVFIAAALAGIAVAIYARIEDWHAGRRWIASLIAGLIARPWARTALRWGAIGLAVVLFPVVWTRSGANQFLAVSDPSLTF